MSSSLFYNTYYGHVSSHPKSSREISAIIDDLLKKKEQLNSQYQEHKQTLDTLESSNEVSDLKIYIEQLKKQLCFYSEHSDILNCSLSLLKKSVVSINDKIIYINTQVKLMKSDILEMKALCARRLSEFNFSQVGFLTMRIQYAYNRSSHLEEKMENLNEYLNEYNLLIEKLSQKLSLIDECKNSIEDIIKKNEAYLKHVEDQISSVKRRLSSIENDIIEIDKNIILGYNVIAKNESYYAKHQERARLAEIARQKKKEDRRIKEEAEREQYRRKLAEAEIQHMSREEDELMKTIEEEERKLAERKQKLIEMRSNIAAKQHKLNGF